MRILIIEDERDLAHALRNGLAHQGFAVDVAADGKQGLSMALGHAYDLLLLDRTMPGLDGLSLCRDLRGRGMRTPVLMLTAKDTVDDRVEGLDSGADDYLVKPFEFKELMARVRAQLRRVVPGKSNRLQVADLTLALDTGEVVRGEHLLALSRKEFMLLAHLMRQPGRVYSKEQLLEQVWDDPSEPNSDVLRAQIKNLRKKIDEPFANKLIRTVHGMGYKIEA